MANKQEARPNAVQSVQMKVWIAVAPVAVFGEGRSKAQVTLGDASSKYLDLLDWTRWQIRKNKREAMPKHLEPLFERIGISTDLWVDRVLNFQTWFRSSVGRPKSMASSAEAHGQNRAISINFARRVSAKA